MSDAPPVREQYGFRRTQCACELCRAPCRHMPGSLDVADLLRLCPPNQDPFRWAEDHLRALTDKAFPTLVPARGLDGHCHWLFEGKCLVHADAPYSCAFFDAHMTEAEIARRSDATIDARRADGQQNGLYYRVWLHLCRKGLIAPSGDREALMAEMQRIRMNVRQLTSPDAIR